MDTLPFRDALSRLENRRVKCIRPLIPPHLLQEDLPLYGTAIVTGVDQLKVDSGRSAQRPLSFKDAWKPKTFLEAMMIGSLLSLGMPHTVSNTIHIQSLTLPKQPLFGS